MKKFNRQKLPELFCEKNSKLILKEPMKTYADGIESKSFEKGTEFIVDDIIGYGYNLKTKEYKEIIRVMNSDMPKYFNKPIQTLKKT